MQKIGNASDSSLQNHTKISSVFWTRIKVFIVAVLSVWALFMNDSLDSLVVNNDDKPKEP